MRLETAKYLYDVHSAAAALAGFVDGCDWAGYRRNAMLRAAVERQFEIIGEALNQLGRHDAALLARVEHHRQIIAFRNILIHGYAEVDDAWCGTWCSPDSSRCASKWMKCSQVADGNARSCQSAE